MQMLFGMKKIRLSLLVAGIGFIVQITYISVVYFQFETNVDVIAEKPDYIEIPGITICIDIMNFSPISLKKIFPNTSFPDKIEGFEPLMRSLAQLPIKDLHRLIELDAKFDINCTFICSFHPSFTKYDACSDVDCSEMSAIRKTLVMGSEYELRSCLTYFFRNPKTPPLREPNIERDLVRLNVRTLDEVLLRITIHESQEIPFMDEIDNIPILSRNLISTNIQYSETHTRHASEFSSDCSEYKKSTFGTKLGCIYDCRRVLTYQRCRSWPFNVPAKPDQVLPFVDPIVGCENNRTLVNWLNKICLTRCYKRNCRNSFYNLLVKSIIYSSINNDSDDSTSIIISRPFGLSIEYNSRLSMRLAEFLVYIGSTLGIWFGVCVVDIIETSKSQFQRFIRLKINYNNLLRTNRRFGRPVPNIFLIPQSDKIFVNVYPRQNQDSMPMKPKLLI